jgi:hypothetical protein
MRDISERVTRTSRELRALATQLQWKAFQNSSPGDQTQILSGLVDSGLIEDLRKAVDQLSHFLWCYIESTAATGCATDNDVQGKHLAQITTMLRLLHRSAYPTEDPLAIVDRITASVEQHLETHNRAAALERTA